MTIETATLIAGSETPIGEGSTGAMRCTLTLKNGARTAAILKRCSLGELAAESFSAVLLRAWGLPVPTPYLVPEGDALSFASADAAYPNLSKRLGLDALPAGPAKDIATRIACALATSLPSSGLAAAADEAICNHDRNLGNILWDGSAEAWIDHAYSMGQAPDHVGADNKLCAMAVLAGTHATLSASAVAQALAISSDAPHSAGIALPTNLHGAAMAAQVSQRLNGLAMAVLGRFPRANDLLSEA